MCEDRSYERPTQHLPWPVRYAYACRQMRKPCAPWLNLALDMWLNEGGCQAGRHARAAARKGELS